MKGVTYLMAHWKEHSLLGRNNGLGYGSSKLLLDTMKRTAFSC